MTKTLQRCDQKINMDGTVQPDFAVFQKEKICAVETSNLCTLMLKILNIPQNVLSKKDNILLG